jgi:hypothetical protein
MRITTGITGSFFVLALALTGCGGDGDDKKTTGSSSTKDDNSDASSSEPLDVCKLITTADLQKQFGSPFDEGELTHQEQTGGDQCVWTNSDAPPVKTFSITVLRQDALGGAIKKSGLSVEELFDQTKAAYPDAQDYDLGDKAFISGSEIQVLEGETSYSFSTFLGTSDTAITGLKALAAQVVG